MITTKSWLNNAFPCREGDSSSPKVSVGDLEQTASFLDSRLRLVGMTLLFVMALFLSPSIFAFQYESPNERDQAQELTHILESGKATEKNVPPAIYFLAQGQYEKAKETLNDQTDSLFPWLPAYLEPLIPITSQMVSTESAHFILYAPPNQIFLADYALPALEQAAAYLEKQFGHRPAGKVRVEIYATKEDFSVGSTLSMETLERSGAIGICKFHRLMITSPQSLPLGYRWLDALSHEYTHLMVNELSDMRAELWLHEGTARYFETGYRLDPPEFLSPKQKTDLQKAAEENRLVSFKRMSPSLVYLKDQAEVSLAFAQVAYSVSKLVEKYAVKNYVQFLNDLKKNPFEKSFAKNFSQSLESFEEKMHADIPLEKWGKTIGAMDDDIHFEKVDENDFVGADVQGEIRLGDRMRLMNRDDAALIQYQKALDQEPDNGVVLLKAARVQLKLGKKSEAEKNLRRAVEKNPNYGTPFITLATLVEPKEAIALLQGAIAINPFDPQVHELLANNYLALGEREKAEREEEILSRFLLARPR